MPPRPGPFATPPKQYILRGKAGGAHGRWTTCTGRSRAQTEIIDFLASQFGRYPFSSGGGIVEDADNLFFALENQTRSIYPKDFFTDRSAATSWWSTRTLTSGTATAWP
jgi:hypothetical protein